MEANEQQETNVGSQGGTNGGVAPAPRCAHGEAFQARNLLAGTSVTVRFISQGIRTPITSSQQPSEPRK